MKKKYFKLFLLMIVLLFVPYFEVLAESGSYNSTYYMTGGLYSARTWDATDTPTFTVTTSNCYAQVPSVIYVMLQRKTLTGWNTTDNDEIDSSGGSCSLDGDGSGKYRIYLRQLTGYVMSGDINFSWTW